MSSTRAKKESLCDQSFTKYPDASCILFDNDFCDGSDGLIELTNGGMINNIEARSGLDIESFAVREGCKLSMYTSKLTILFKNKNDVFFNLHSIC